MTGQNDIERLIASMASGEPIDWDAARKLVLTDEDQARFEALRGIEQIAAFSHAQWAKFDPLDHAPPPQAFESEPIAGDRVGAYTLESRIGEGGMGTVWLARRSDGRFEARAAVKLLRLPRVGRDGIARFEREGQILARLRHANIAHLLDAGVTPIGQPYLILEYIDGVSIDRYCEDHGLNVRERIALFIEVLRAVAHAQSNLVLHRDLKPSNILVDDAGHVKLLDFGIAKLLEADSVAASETELTQRAGHAFTPAFAAPEQLHGDPVTTATDVYAAGMVLYLLLTGKHATGAQRGSPVERMQAILHTAPKLASDAVTEIVETGDQATATSSSKSLAPAQRRRELQGDLDNILAKALKKAPDERYASAAAFADDLRRYLAQEPVTARADTITYRVGKFVRRHRLGVVSASVAILALMGVTVVAISQLIEARRQRDEARAQTQRAEAFNTVVTSLLSQTGPGGRALSPEELLDQAVDEMQTLYADDPAFQVDMLIRISGRYFDLRNSNKEHATLLEAEEIARRTGDPVLMFRVQVNTVETELSLGRKPEAQQRIEAARQLLPKLDPVPSLHDYYRAEAEFARSNGDLPGATEYLEKARRVLEAEDRVHGNSYVGLLSLLRRNHMQLGNMLEAHEHALAWADVEKRHHREGNVSGITSQAVLATSFYGLGEVVRARAIYEAALPEFKVASSTDSPAPLNTLAYGYGDILSRLGRHEPAIKLIRGGIEAADRGGNQGYRMRARLTLARALVRAGRANEAQQPLDEAVAGMMSDEAANHTWLIEAALIQAEVHRTQAQLDLALREAEVALRRIGYPEKHQGYSLPQALLTLARVQRAQSAFAPALESARAALHLFEQNTLDPKQSADVGEAWLELAQVQLATGESAAAAKSMAHAIPCLRNGLGPDHELTRQSEQFAQGSP